MLVVYLPKVKLGELQCTKYTPSVWMHAHINKCMLIHYNGELGVPILSHLLTRGEEN